MLPKGKIILEKKLTRQELVGINDTISKEVDGFLFLPEERSIIQVYIKENEQLVGEIPIKDIIKVLPIDIIKKLIREIEQ